MFMHDAQKEDHNDGCEQQAAMHANNICVKFHAYNVWCKQDQDMTAGCTLPLYMALSFLLVLFSSLQAAPQPCHLPSQHLPLAAGLHQLPLKLHATHTSECQVFFFCRAPWGPKSVFKCVLIQNPYAFNSIVTVAEKQDLQPKHILHNHQHTLLKLAGCKSG